MSEFRYRFRGGLALLVAAVMVAGSLLLSASAGARVRATAVAPAASASCSLAKVGEKLGPSYVEKLRVTNVSCGSGDSLVKAYNSCRLKHGGVKGRCTAKVDGYRCVEKRYTGSPDQFIAAVTCTKSRDAVDFTYSENT
jgi:hypothetical protein